MWWLGVTHRPLGRPPFASRAPFRTFHVRPTPDAFLILWVALWWSRSPPGHPPFLIQSVPPSSGLPPVTQSLSFSRRLLCTFHNPKMFIKHELLYYLTQITANHTSVRLTVATTIFTGNGQFFIKPLCQFMNANTLIMNLCVPSVNIRSLRKLT